ncbi:hypothetical protein M3J09_011310 [Ascochyta lentis]
MRDNRTGHGQLLCQSRLQIWLLLRSALPTSTSHCHAFGLSHVLCTTTQPSDAVTTAGHTVSPCANLLHGMAAVLGRAKVSNLIASVQRRDVYVSPSQQELTTKNKRKQYHIHLPVLM